MKNIENTNWESRFDEAFPMQVYVFREHDMTMRVVCQGNPCTLHPTHERAAKDIKDFIRTLLHDTEIAAREEIEKMIGEHNARILNEFQLQGKPDMPMIAYDERVCLAPAIERATKDTLSSLTKE
jgi:hypothetical protein